MSLFNSFYTKPGPGVSLNEPRKKGFARLLELLGRDFTSYWKAGVLTSVCFVPSAACAFLAVDTGALVFVLLGGLLGGLGGPCLAGLYDTVLRTLRDEPGYWWHVYKKAVHRNAKSAVVPGMVTAFLLCLELYSARIVISMPEPSLLAAFCLLVSSVFILAMLSLYWVQFVLMELPAPVMLRNCVLLFFGILPRALGAAAWQLVYWTGAVLLLPFSFLVYLVTGPWLPALLSSLTVYAAVEKTFGIEEKLAQQREEADEAERAERAARYAQTRQDQQTETK